VTYDPSAARSSSVFSDIPSYQASWICYINGIEVPILGFSTSCSVGQIPSFTISLAPHPSLERLGVEDRVPVAIFYLDYWHTPEAPEFRLLIDGEIVGWSYTNYMGRRAMTFDCLSHIHVLQQLYFFYMTNVDDVVAAQSPTVMAQGFSTPGLLYPYALFHKGLLATSEQIQAAQPRRPGAVGQSDLPAQDDNSDATKLIQAPYELLYNVIRGVIGKNVPAERRSIPMLNFFARHVRKTRLYNRFVRLPFLEDPAVIGERKGVFPIFNAARNDEAMNAMQRQAASQVGNSGPVWNLLQQLFSDVYMDIAMIPNPAAVTVSLGNDDGQIERVLDDNTPITAQRPPETIDDNALREQAEQLARDLLRAVEQNVSADPALLREAGLSEAPTSAEQISVNTIFENLRQRAELAQASQVHEGVDPMHPIRLAQYFVKPPMYFGIPPHCNVVFPSQIKGFGFNENYFEQPTRVYVNDSVLTSLLRTSGPNRHFMLHALTVAYPDEANALMEHKVGGDTNSAETPATPSMLETGKNLLIWPVEFFQGPVTHRVALPTWFQYLRQFNNARPTNESTSDTPTNTTTATIPNVPGVPAPPLTNVTIPPTITAERRGMVFERERARPDFAYRWLISEEALAEGNRKTVRYSMPTYAQLTTHGQVRSRRTGQMIPNYQQPISPSLRVFIEHIRSLFPIIHSVGHVSGYHSEILDLSRPADPHKAGRAVDFMIRTVRRGSQYGLPDLEHGTPIAEYLVRNCDVFGVQYLIWARSQWNSSKPPGIGPGKKFSHYTVNPNDERFDHFDHIHVELSEEAVQGLLPFYQNQVSRSAAPVPRTTVPLRPGQNAHTNTMTTELAQPSTATAPPTFRTVTRPVAAAQSSTTEGESNSDQSFRELYRLYAQHKALHDKYMARRAAAQLLFNPYIVVGFPAMVFDAMSSRFHMVGYVQSVSHSGSADGSLETAVQYTCCRTFSEFIADVRTDAERFAARVTAAPAEIVDEIRAIIQDENNAEAFYRRLFYGNGPRYQNAPTAFRWDKAVGYANGTLGVTDIEVNGISVAEDIARRNPAASPTSTTVTGGFSSAAETQSTQVSEAPNQRQTVTTAGSNSTEQTVTSNLDPNQELSPQTNIYQDAFDKYDIAMQLSARAVCSLTQYIRFWHGGRTINDLMAEGEVGQELDGYAYVEVPTQDVVATSVDSSGQPRNIRSTTVRKSAIFYSRIFKLRPGPGLGPDHLQPPTEAEQGYTNPPNIQPSSTHAGVAANFPQTRADWDEVLLRYREMIRSQIAPR
jgi:hypothetical protein